MIKKILNTIFGRMSQDQRATREVGELDRQIYDAERALHHAKHTLDYLEERREFLRREYGMSIPVLRTPLTERMAHRHAAGA